MKTLMIAAAAFATLIVASVTDADARPGFRGGGYRGGGYRGVAVGRGYRGGIGRPGWGAAGPSRGARAGAGRAGQAGARRAQSPAGRAGGAMDIGLMAVIAVTATAIVGTAMAWRRPGLRPESAPRTTAAAGHMPTTTHTTAPVATTDRQHLHR